MFKINNKLETNRSSLKASVRTRIATFVALLGLIAYSILNPVIASAKASSNQASYKHSKPKVYALISLPGKNSKRVYTLLSQGETLVHPDKSNKGLMDKYIHTLNLGTMILTDNRGSRRRFDFQEILKNEGAVKIPDFEGYLFEKTVVVSRVNETHIQVKGEPFPMRLLESIDEKSEGVIIDLITETNDTNYPLEEAPRPLYEAPVDLGDDSIIKGVQDFETEPVVRKDVPENENQKEVPYKKLKEGTKMPFTPKEITLPLGAADERQVMEITPASGYAPMKTEPVSEKSKQEMRKALGME